MMTTTKMQRRGLYLRLCSYCNKGISVGYVWGNGEAYGCDHCYTEHLLRWALDLADNHFFRESENKEEFIIDITDQLYVGWTLEDDFEEYYTREGKTVLEVGKEDVVIIGEELWDPLTQNYEWKEVHNVEI
tara:strand:- start:1757 stop:2149 length:393 start_codon:yes stop_codon:yes gene_type:complete